MPGMAKTTFLAGIYRCNSGIIHPLSECNCKVEEWLCLYPCGKLAEMAETIHLNVSPMANDQ